VEESCLVEQKVKQIIVEQLGVDEAQVDSTAFVRGRLGRGLPSTSWNWSWRSKRPSSWDIRTGCRKITTVKDAVDYIEAKQAKK
jgi:acyl carrier protein